jgi:hypothetical protein
VLARRRTTLTSFRVNPKPCCKVERRLMPFPAG